MNTDFFAFLRWCVDDHAPIPYELDKMDWAALYQFMQEQALLGVGFEGINKVSGSKGQGARKIPREILLQWLAASEQIRQRNQVLNKRCVEVSQYFERSGFDTCVLKGQGNAVMYPNPYSRTCGDIDIWCLAPSSSKDKGNLSGEWDQKIKDIIRFVRRRNPKGKICFHHIDAGMFDGVDVEVHYRPSFMNNLIYNRRLQRWFDAHTDIIDDTAYKIESGRREVDLPGGAGKIYVPTTAFNIVYQLAHLYNHLIHEGIGLRQFVDYFYLLKANKELEGVRGSYRSAQGVKGQYHETLSKLNLYKFAGAVMYVMREVFALDGQYMIAPVDEKRGRFLLNEIMLGGNFGQHDSRVNRAVSPLARNIQRLKRDFRLVRYFPSECLWEPVFRWYHFFWRLRHANV